MQEMSFQYLIKTILNIGIYIYFLRILYILFIRQDRYKVWEVLGWASYGKLPISSNKYGLLDQIFSCVIN